jgi:hypothetical protein
VEGVEENLKKWSGSRSDTNCRSEIDAKLKFGSSHPLDSRDSDSTTDADCLYVALLGVVQSETLLTAVRDRRGQDLTVLTSGVIRARNKYEINKNLL